MLNLLTNKLGTGIGGGDNKEITAFYFLAKTVGEVTFVENGKQKIVDFRRGFFDFVEKQERSRMAFD